MMDNANLRMSNIELCRLVSIFLIILLHSTWQSLGFPNSMDDLDPLPLFFYSISICGVDVFLLITGWFGLNLKKSSVINLFWISLFCGLIRIGFNFYTGTFSYSMLLFISKSNWFVVSYIGLLIVSPILNRFVDSASFKSFTCLILTFYFYSIWFNLIPAQAAIEPGFHNGCSVLWFIEVYLIGRYLNKYGLPFIKKNSLCIYVILVIIIMIMTYLAFYMSFTYLRTGNVDFIIGRIGAQNNPLVLGAAICFFYTFQRIRMKHSRSINCIAKSVLSILILHGVFFDYMRDYYQWLIIEDSWIVVKTLMWIAGAVAMMSFCIVLDQVRILLFNPIRKYLL